VWRNPRLILFVVTVIVFVTAALVAMHRLTRPAWDAAVHDAAAVADAKTWLLGLAAPAGMQVDITSTSCEVPAEFCATSTQSPRDLFDDVVAALVQAGAPAHEKSCIEALGANPIHMCSGTLAFRRVPVDVVSDDRTGLGRRTPWSWVRVSVRDPSNVQVSSAPLTTLGEAHAMPTTWRTASKCAKPVGADCARYEVSFTLRVAPAAVLDTWIRHLEATHWRVDRAGCRTQGSGRCTLLAMRYRGAHGADLVVLSGRLERSSGASVKATALVSTLS
jgi:hypothetical protein